MRDLDRRAVLAGGLAAAGAGVLGGCDPASVPPGSAYGSTSAKASGGSVPAVLRKPAG